jgi:hypothetical protein
MYYTVYFYFLIIEYRRVRKQHMQLVWLALGCHDDTLHTREHADKKHIHVCDIMIAITRLPSLLHRHFLYRVSQVDFKHRHTHHEQTSSAELEVEQNELQVQVRHGSVAAISHDRKEFPSGWCSGMESQYQ